MNMKKVTLYKKDIITLCSIRNFIEKLVSCENPAVYDFVLENLTPGDYDNFECIVKRVLRDDKL
jgi:hypothetical protein